MIDMSSFFQFNNQEGSHFFCNTLDKNADALLKPHKRIILETLPVYIQLFEANWMTLLIFTESENKQSLVDV